MRFGDLNQLANRGFRTHGDGVLHHTGFEFLHTAHFSGLRGDIHVFVQDADATFLRHGNRHACFGNSVHGSRH